MTANQHIDQMELYRRMKGDRKADYNLDDLTEEFLDIEDVLEPNVPFDAPSVLARAERLWDKMELNCNLPMATLAEVPFLDVQHKTEPFAFRRARAERMTPITIDSFSEIGRRPSVISGGSPLMSKLLLAASSVWFSSYNTMHINLDRGPFHDVLYDHDKYRRYNRTFPEVSYREFEMNFINEIEIPTFYEDPWESNTPNILKSWAQIQPPEWSVKPEIDWDNKIVKTNPHVCHYPSRKHFVDIETDLYPIVIDESSKPLVEQFWNSFNKSKKDKLNKIY